MPDLILDALAHIPDVFFIQIGSNDGVANDPLHQLIITHRSWRGIFVEPLSTVYDRLVTNYCEESRFTFVNAAITTATGHCDFYSVSESASSLLPDRYRPWSTQLGSLDRAHILRHFDGILAPFVVCNQIECLTLRDLLSMHNVSAVDLLHIDAEGADFSILLQLDFLRYAPRVILYEHKHLSHADASSATSVLVQAGYSVTHFADDTLAVRARSNVA